MSARFAGSLALAVAAAVGLPGVATQTYCPSANDLVVAYTVPGSSNQLLDGGWSNQGKRCKPDNC